MGGHIEYINGFPVWVDDETKWKTSYTSTTTDMPNDWPYYQPVSTTAKPNFDKPKADTPKMSAADAAVTINLLVSDCNPEWVDKNRAQAALVVARESLHRDIPTPVKRDYSGLKHRYICPKCGLPVSRKEDVNYCGTCGKRLDWRGSYDKLL